MASVQTAGPSRGRVSLDHIVIGVLVIVVIASAASLLGLDVGGWLKKVWNTITAISLGYLIAGIALITLQTTTTAYAWYSILRYAYPDQGVRWVQVLACYSTAVALNFVLPANLGTLVMLLMFTTLIAACTFAGAAAGYVVQKIFYSVIGMACYLYLFLSVGGTFSLQLGFLSEHPIAAIVLFGGVVMLLVMVGRVLRKRIAEWWEEAKIGGAILANRRMYLSRVLLPEVISWFAMLGIIAVFLAAYDIPVSFHTLMRVVAGNSMANMTSVTPGGAGVVQGFNVLSLKGITSSANATAYSVAQQLVTTAWSILFAIVMLARAFGWNDGKSLVTQSYGEAREKSAEQAQARKAKRGAKREARHAQDVAEAER